MSATLAPSAARVSVSPRVETTAAPLANLYRRRPTVRRALLCISFAQKASAQVLAGDTPDPVHSYAQQSAGEVEGVAAMVLDMFGAHRQVETPDLSAITRRSRSSRHEEWVATCLEHAFGLLNEMDIDNASFRGVITTVEWAAGICDSMVMFDREPYLAILEELLGTVR